MKNALAQLLLTVAAFLPEMWRATAHTLAAVVSNSTWGDDDPRWSEVLVVVNESLRDIQSVGEQTGDAAKAARASAELKIGRELRRLGLVEIV